MDWTTLYEMAKSVIAFGSLLILVFLGLQKLVKRLYSGTNAPPPNSISELVLRLSKRVDNLFRWWLEIPLSFPVTIPDNAPSAERVGYYVSEYLFYYNTYFSRQPVSFLALTILNIFGRIGILVVSISLIIIPVSLIFSRAIPIYVTPLVLAAFIIGLILFDVAFSIHASLRMPSYYVPHALQIINSNIIIDNRYVLSIKNFDDIIIKKVGCWITQR